MRQHDLLSVGGADARPTGVAEPRGRPGAWAAVTCIAGVLGVVLFFAPLRGIDLARMNGLGLISVLPPASLFGVVLLVLAFMAALALPRVYPVVLGILLAGIVLCLDGVTAVAEAEPRFASAYQIAGFSEFVMRTGHSAPGLEAYFSWPGFFALVAFAAGAAGSHDLMVVLRWWPTVVDMLYLVPLGLIMRNLRATWQATWFAAFVFTVGNWVGQDYFSPQSFSYLLYLTFIAMLLTWFGTGVRGGPDSADPRSVGLAAAAQGGGVVASRGARKLTLGTARGRESAGPPWASTAAGTATPAGPPRRVRHRAFGLLVPGELPSKAASSNQRTMLLVLMIMMFTASTVSHQLSPFFMVGACTALVVVRRCGLTGLPVLLTAIVSGWFSFATVGYWSGHIGNVIGGFGHVFSNVTTSVGGRVTAGASPVHQLVLYGRTLFAVSILLLAGIGLLRRRYRGVDDRAVLALLVMPLLGFGLQSYGGEMSLRIYLFMLPSAAILAAYLFFPATREGRCSRIALLVAGVLAVTSVIVFFVVRYGNEAYEQTPSGEISAFNYLYARDSAGINVLWLSEAPSTDDTPEMPWQYRDVEKINFQPVQAPTDPAKVAALVADLKKAGPGSYLITTITQENYFQQEASYKTGWGGQFRADMGAAPGVQTVFANSDSVIYTLRFPPGTPRKTALLNPAGSPIRSTVWTPAGLAVLGLLLLVLAVREFAVVRLGPPSRLIRPLTYAAVPLLLMFVIVVIERFVLLS